MQSSSLLFSILPLLVFVIADAFLGQKNAIKAAILAAIFEIVISLIYFGKIDELSMVSASLIIICSAVSWWKKDSIHIKFQPVVLGVIFGLFLIVSYWMGHPILLILMDKYQSALPLQMQGSLGSPYFRLFLKELSHYFGYFLLIHAALVAYAALYLTNWWWLMIRIVGQYVAMLAAYIFTVFILKS